MSVVTQRYALKTKKLDAQLQREDRAETLQSGKRDELGIIYTELNTKARHYRSALMDVHSHLYGDRRKQSSFDTLESARQAFAECNSRAQMLVPREILIKATIANVALGDGFRVLMSPPGSMSRDEVSAVVDKNCRSAVNDLRDAMRVSLGIDTGDLPDQ